MDKKQILDRAVSFSLGCDENSLRSNDVRMKSPVLYILLGEQVKEGLTSIKESMAHNLLNAEGAVYFLIRDNVIEEKDLEEQKASNVVVLTLPESDSKLSRGKLAHLIEEDNFLESLNQAVLKLRELILRQNKVFSYWEQVNISIITSASDLSNVLLSDIAILVKNKLEQDFKQVFLDLFVLLEETTEDSTPLNKALAFSFFKELDTYQMPEFIYEKKLERLEDGLKLKVRHEKRLFNLVYLLSDKNEQGQKINQVKQIHYETIAAISLLKNRQQKFIELEESREQYNHNVFTSNIEYDTRNRYASARLAKVKKPEAGIYLATAYHLFKTYFKGLAYNEAEGSHVLLEVLGLSEEQIRQKVESSLPQNLSVSEIYSLISRNISFKELRNLSFKEAESLLYGQTAREFFDLNFEKAGEKALREMLQEEKLRSKLTTEVVNQPSFGPFAIDYLLHSIDFNKLERQKEKYEYSRRQYEAQLEEKENQIVGAHIGSNFGLFDKKYLREVKDYLIEEVYETRYRILLEKLKRIALEETQKSLETFNESLQEKLKQIRNIESLFLESLEEMNKYEEAYLVQNVKEYYEGIAEKKLEALRKQKGDNFLYDENYIGSITKVLEEDETYFLNKLFEVIERSILSDKKYFSLAFEEELLARANMLIDYKDKEVVAKSELYDLLYQSLEENSKPCVHLDTTLSTHRYEEKYFFGDRQSEFINYAYKRDQGSRSYKIGTMGDGRKSVIEKIQLMGGFRLQDLVFTKSAERYYEAYQEEGYPFHLEVERSKEGGQDGE